MWHRAVGVMVVCWLGAACNQLLGIPDVTQGRVVGGRVHGLWDGADGVALRLVANGVDTLLTASNGEFHFQPQFRPGTSYTVTVVTNPVQHTCIVDGGGNGLVGDGDVTSVSIACTGPALTVGFSGPWAWTFDPTEETQTFSGSVVAREVALTVSGPRITSATVNGTALALGQPSAAIALPLGPTSAHIGVTASGGLSKTYELVFQRGAAIIDQLTYGKASNTGVNDTFGFSMSLSGTTLAVGAPGEASATIDPTDNAAADAGAVYVFVRTGASWIQQAYLKASNIDASDGFGTSVALSGDTLAVGAPGEASATATDPTDNTASGAGAVYVFIRKDGTWSQQAYVKAPSIGAKDQFGKSVSLSQDTLAVGAPLEDSARASDPNDNNAPDAGAVYVFVRNGVGWNPQGYLKASNLEGGDQFGFSVSVSGDSLAVGAINEASGTGNKTDDSAPGAGAVYVFTRASQKWTEQAYLKASNASAGYLFGYSVALSQDTLAVGSLTEFSAATGVNGNQTDQSAPGSGAAYVFSRDGATWTEQAYIKASNTGPGDTFGSSVALSGELLAVSAIAEASSTTGTNGNQADNSATGAGAVYVYLRTGTTWAQQAYLKASNTGKSDNFGGSIALSPDTLVVASPTEASGSTGFTGNPADNSTPRSGAFYAFR